MRKPVTDEEIEGLEEDGDLDAFDGPIAALVARIEADAARIAALESALAALRVVAEKARAVYCVEDENEDGSWSRHHVGVDELCSALDALDAARVKP